MHYTKVDMVYALFLPPYILNMKHSFFPIWIYFHTYILNYYKLARIHANILSPTGLKFKLNQGF